MSRKLARIIDSHQHFWELSRGDYDWLTEENTILYRDFLPADFKPLLDTCKITGTVLVQAAPTIAETLYLLDISRTEKLVKGVVGWVDLAKESSIEDIKVLLRNPTLKGFRLMLQDIKDNNWIAKAPKDLVLNYLSKTKLTMDLLINEAHVQPTISFVKRWPDISMVIDHCAKPNLDTGSFQDWSESMRILSKLPNLYIKISGLFTQSKVKPNLKIIERYLLRTIDYFGYERVMWGSDWPVMTSHGDYASWLEACNSVIDAASFKEQEKEAIFYSNAYNFYNLTQ